LATLMILAIAIPLPAVHPEIVTVWSAKSIFPDTFSWPNDDGTAEHGGS